MAGGVPLGEPAQLAQRALTIDPDFARAHAQMGYIAMSHIGDLQLAAGHLQRALALAPALSSSRAAPAPP